MIYYKNLDGLRGISVILVVLFHLNLEVFWFGWIGVQFFFVLSGFLITNILTQNKSSKKYFSVFYYRRMLQIFPLYYAILIFTLIYCLIFQLNFNDFYLYLFYVQNFYLSYNQWKIEAPSFLNHTWTLAIEEQFYFIYPAIIYFFKEKLITWIVLFLIILSIFFKYILLLNFTNNSFLWANTISSLDFLLSGSILSLTMRNKKNKYFLFFLFLIVMFVYLFVCFFYLSVSPFSFPFNVATFRGVIFLNLLLVFVTLIVNLLSQTENDLIKILFSNKILIYIGKISYGIYIYHYLVFYFIDNYFSVLNFDIYLIITIKLFFTLLISSLSWHYFEKKFLFYKKNYVLTNFISKT